MGESRPLVIVLEADETIGRAAFEVVTELGHDCVVVRTTTDIKPYLARDGLTVIVAAAEAVASTDQLRVIRLAIKQSSTGVRRPTRRMRESLRLELLTVLDAG